MTSRIRWIERSPDLYEARLTAPDGRDMYLGYVAISLGLGVWRGYVGLEFVPVGSGPRAVVQRAVERRALERLGRGLEGSTNGGRKAATHAP